MKLMKRVLALCLTVMMVCSLFAVAAPSASALAGAKQGGDGKIYAWGCDMSQWNVNGATYTDYSLVDFKKMKADGCEFVILRIGDEKAGYGARKADPTFPTLYKMAREAGMHVGAYYYSYKTTRAGSEGDAKFCIDIMEKNNMYFDYPIYFDVEADVQEGLSTSKLVDLCLGWCETMVAAGYFPGVYSTAAHSLNELQNSASFNYDTWVARVKTNGTGSQFNPKTEKPEYKTQYGMWQYKWYNTSKTPSYAGSYWVDSNGNCPLDCNVAYRDYPTIMQTYGYNNVVTKHTISFESNGGSAVANVMVMDGEKLTAPTAPTKLGFDFGGWYCNPELTDPYDFNTAVPYDFTLYAKWNEANWAINNNLMPNSAQLQLNSYNSADEKIWPYWNNDSYNSVTFYNGVTSEWSWPSAYMSYQNSFDAVNEGYLYVKKDGTAQFNVTLTYLDKDGVEREVNLTDVANSSEADLPAGALEEFYNVGSYIRNLGHAPASGKVKFTKVTYFVIGATDSYVKLYDIKFTSKFALPDSYKTMMNSNITQLSGVGSYTYNNGKLTMNA
ncbi:MAG: InlB B-repeat-containing protein, partial [Clostridia bacterium]|nr:InlB B-repeat-containing protein [Clostridia bacterium]